MEMTLQAQGPFCGTRALPTGAARFRIRLVPGPFSHSSAGPKGFPGMRVAPCMVASSDYPRRRPRRSLIPKIKGPTPKGFAPRPQVGTSTQKKDQEEKEGPSTSGSGEQITPETGGTEIVSSSPVKETTAMSQEAGEKNVATDSQEAEEGNVEVEDKRDETVSSTMHQFMVNSNKIVEKGTVINTLENVTELDVSSKREVGSGLINQAEVAPKYGPSSDLEKNHDDEMEDTLVGIDEEISMTGRTEIVSSSPVKETTAMSQEAGEQNVAADSQEAEEGDAEVEDKRDETVSSTMHQFMVSSNEIVEKGIVINTLENVTELDISSQTEVGSVVVNQAEVAPKHGPSSDLEKVLDDEMEDNLVGIDEEISRMAQKPSAVVDSDVRIIGTRDLLKLDKGYTNEEAGFEESLVEQKVMMDPQVQKKMLEDLAEENLSNGNKVFVYPQAVEPDQVIHVFFNRSLSALMNEPDVLIMGAFNDWRWKSFTKNLLRTNLSGDWCSCEIPIPKEAYKMDFVFFNGGHVYENNNFNDFCVALEGGMDVSAFEDFLLEEKRRELEKLAKEQADRERQAEEQRQKEQEQAAREAEKSQAKLEAEKRRQALHQVMKQAVISFDNVWYIEPSVFKGEDKIRLFYNRSSRPLAHATEIWIHGGHDNWKDGPSIVERLFCSEKKDGDWWYADVVVPDRALVLDWVFADGPPQSAKVYDNNDYEDFHATVPNCISKELYWAEEEQLIYRKLQEERKLKEDAIRRKAEKAARMKAETKAKTIKMFLLSQKHIVYTEPLDVQGGKTVTVFYNPSNTVLNGKPDIWFRCSFNRWTHGDGPLPPQRMVPVNNGSHVKATVKVPLDAYMMDFVFSEREDGGIYDNKNGMDYHIPVTGGLYKEPPMHIVHVAVEMAPIAKVGGLGDIVTSLSRAVQDLGHTIDIILPKYDCMNLSNVKDFQFNQSFAWGGTEIKVWFGKVEGLSVYFLEPQNGMFWAGCIYGGRNDGERFGFFCHAALEFLLQCGSHPDILHCHDWSSAPVAWLFKEHYRHYGLSNARVIFTIHNLEFGAHFIGKAMTHADKATTVSHNYAKEVSGNSLIAPHLFKFHGILNGIDPDIWDPCNDNFIPVPYTSENVVEGKRAAKETLQQRLGLRRSDLPLVGIITRLTVQKGIHLIKHAIWRTLEQNGQVVLLGSAPDPRIQNDFVNLANQLHSSHADCVRLCLTYDEPLSHLIYAGSDFILVPSVFEPCGLTQLIAMRYGSIPVVRKTGGLYDTVFDVDNDKGRAQAQGLEPNGFSFDGTDSGCVDYALNRALSAWFDGRDWFNSLCKRVMEQDWSWNRPALDYMELYYAARK